MEEEACEKWVGLSEPELLFISTMKTQVIKNYTFFVKDKS